jgi:hypothetical protein
VSDLPHLPGSNDQREREISRAAQRSGLANVETQLLALWARFGKNPCFLTYEKQAKLIRKRNGKNPHPEHVGRASRKLARLGYSEHKRIPPGRRPRGATHTSPHGTTENKPIWEALNVTSVPRLRGERVRQAHALEQRRDFAPPPPEVMRLARRCLRPPVSRAVIEQRGMTSEEIAHAIGETLDVGQRDRAPPD